VAVSYSSSSSTRQKIGARGYGDLLFRHSQVGLVATNFSAASLGSSFEK
jgi:hypothetical protein